jgi:hypothetical protein
MAHARQANKTNHHGDVYRMGHDMRGIFDL